MTEKERKRLLRVPMCLCHGIWIHPSCTMLDFYDAERRLLEHEALSDFRAKRFGPNFYSRKFSRNAV